MKVVVDPGHGGTTRVGGSSPNNARGGALGTLEKNLTLKVAQRVEQLSQNLFDITLTRHEDVNLGLSDRARVAQRLSADLFLSIHFNGWHTPNVQGTETYIHSRASSDSREFGQAIQSSVQSTTAYRDRGLKTGNYGVINPNYHADHTAACLLEISFISDPQDDVRLQDDNYITQLAQSIVNSCVEFGRAKGLLQERNEEEKEDACCAPCQPCPQPTPDVNITETIGLHPPQQTAPKKAPQKSFNGLQTFSWGESELTSKLATADAAVRPLSEMGQVQAGRYVLKQLYEQLAPTSLVKKTSFKEIYSEKEPLTGTHLIKFRQQINTVPIYGSYVVISLTSSNEVLNFHGSLTIDDFGELQATLAPTAIMSLCSTIGQTGDDTTPELLYFFDSASRQWRESYLVADLQGANADGEHELECGGSKAEDLENLALLPSYVDLFVDANTGDIVHKKSRVKCADQYEQKSMQAKDGLGRLRTFEVTTYPDSDDPAWMYCREHNVHTCDAGYGDIALPSTRLPGPYAAQPPGEFDPAAVAAHANTIEVAEFFKSVLSRNGIDGNGGPLISTVNCVFDNKYPQSDARSLVWRNAARMPTQMIYGQQFIDGKLRSFAESKDVVAHELVHGITAATSDLEYQDEPGALNESYSDILGVIISNWAISDLNDWDWRVGEEIVATVLPMRDISDPSNASRPQPSHMDDYVYMISDHGGVHTNSGIHNRAAYNVMTAKTGDDDWLFTPTEFTQLFYLCLVQFLSRTSKFTDSLIGLKRSCELLFRNDANLEKKKQAIIDGFADVGIYDHTRQPVVNNTATGSKAPSVDQMLKAYKAADEFEDLTQVKGIGSAHQESLYHQGIKTMDALAQLTDTQIRELEGELSVSKTTLKRWRTAAQKYA